MTAKEIIALVLVVIVLLLNTMIAIGFLRGRRDELRSFRDRDATARDELHRRVQDLTTKRK